MKGKKDGLRAEQIRAALKIQSKMQSKEMPRVLQEGLSKKKLEQGAEARDDVHCGVSHPSTCIVCGYVIVAAKNHDVPFDAAARLFPRQTCKECGKAAHVRCFNGPGTYWVECDGGHRYSTG